MIVFKNKELKIGLTILKVEDISKKKNSMTRNQKVKKDKMYNRINIGKKKSGREEGIKIDVPEKCELKKKKTMIMSRKNGVQ